jgi:hypothetical protein
VKGRAHLVCEGLEACGAARLEERRIPSSESVGRVREASRPLLDGGRVLRQNARSGGGLEERSEGLARPGGTDHEEAIDTLRRHQLTGLPVERR